MTSVLKHRKLLKLVALSLADCTCPLPSAQGPAEHIGEVPAGEILNIIQHPSPWPLDPSPCELQGIYTMEAVAAAVLQRRIPRIPPHQASLWFNAGPAGDFVHSDSLKGSAKLAAELRFGNILPRASCVVELVLLNLQVAGSVVSRMWCGKPA